MDNSFLYFRLADQILDYIDQKHIRAGERIPSERALAEMFKTSRTSVREAVRILENKGILEIQVGNGMYLKTDPGIDLYRIELWRIDYAELLDVKKVLDLAVIEELCGYVPPAEITSIEEALREMDQSYEEGQYNHPADVLFHKRLRNCSRNATMAQILDSLTQKLEAYGHELTSFEKYWYQTVPFHRQMWEAILCHEPEAAAAAYLEIYSLDREALRRK